MLRTLTYLIPEAYSKPCQVYKMMRNIENTGTVRRVCSSIWHESFYKTLHHKLLTVFWIHLCLDNCSVVSTVCFRHIQTSDIFTILIICKEMWEANSYLVGILRHIQAYSALLRPIKAYLVPSVTLTCWQPCHIPSPGI